jgi:hypothetical protein
VFGNRAFGAKLAAALAVIALLGIRAVALDHARRPSLVTILLEAEKRDGTRVRVSDLRVVASDAAGFEVEAGGVRARVTPAAAVAPGDLISITARVDARGPALRLEDVRPLPGGWLAPYGGGFSLALAFLVAVNFLRHFAWRPSAARVEGVPE